MTAVEIQAPTIVSCAGGTLTFTEDGRVTWEGPDASATSAIPEIRGAIMCTSGAGRIGRASLRKTDRPSGAPGPIRASWRR